MELDRIIQHCLHELDGPAWIAKRVEVMPGVVDSEIIHITPEMDRLYGYVWPDTLVGRRISEIHTLTDAQLMNAFSLTQTQVTNLRNNKLIPAAAAADEIRAATGQ